MDLSEIPFDTPVILHSLFKRANLQNPLGSNKALCLGDTRDFYEQLVLRRVHGDKVAIQSVRNGRFLKVLASGCCVFEAKKTGDWELFTMEIDAQCSLFFVSCHTGNVLQCDGNNVVKCANENRLGWEAWRILEPRNAAPVAVNQTQTSNTLVGKARHDFVLTLVKYGRSADEIEQIVTHLFDNSEVVNDHSPTLEAVLVDKE